MLALILNSQEGNLAVTTRAVIDYAVQLAADSADDDMLADATVATAVLATATETAGALVYVLIDDDQRAALDRLVADAEIQADAVAALGDADPVQVRLSLGVGLHYETTERITDMRRS